MTPQHAIADAGIEEAEIIPLTGGKNNRVWKVKTTQSYLLKEYFISEVDQRDRKGRELKLLAYAANIGISVVPKIINPLSGQYALLEFLDGETPTRITIKDIESALTFLQHLNSYREQLPARELPPAADACFTSQEHQDKVAQRVKRLDHIQDANVKGLVSDINRYWKKWCASLSSDITQLSPKQRCISPSDFGFHNSIRTTAGLKFIDFEYAGWDDPVKLIVDFCYQPNRILPISFAQYFTQTFIGQLELDPAIRKRLLLFGPGYIIKWACICLNNFLPELDVKVKFTDINREETDAHQLAKAERMIKLVDTFYLA